MGAISSMPAHPSKGNQRTPRDSNAMLETSEEFTRNNCKVFMHQFLININSHHLINNVNFLIPIYIYFKNIINFKIVIKKIYTIN